MGNARIDEQAIGWSYITKSGVILGMVAWSVAFLGPFFDGRGFWDAIEDPVSTNGITMEGA